MAYKELSPDRVGRIRQRMGLTQQQLASLLGISCATVSRWERRPSRAAWYGAIVLAFLDDAESCGLDPAQIVDTLAGCRGDQTAIVKALSDLLGQRAPLQMGAR